MRYIITAKNIQDDLTVTDPLKRTEIATELISTRMKALSMLDSGIISDQDVIVTRADRRCLYDKIFENIIDWSEFEKLDDEHLLSHDIIDLVKDICDGTIDSAENFNEAFPVIPESIFDISLDCDKELYKRPFICVLLREVKNNPEKNLKRGYWGNFIFDFKSQNPGMDVFVFGENVGDSIEMVNGVMRVSTFRGWCALLSNENCKAVVSACSGGVYPIFFTGHKKSKLLIIDNNELVTKHSNSPSFYHNCINFKNVELRFLNYVPNEQRLCQEIYMYAGI